MPRDIWFYEAVIISVSNLRISQVGGRGGTVFERQFDARANVPPQSQEPARVRGKFFESARSLGVSDRPESRRQHSHCQGSELGKIRAETPWKEGIHGN